MRNLMCILTSLAFVMGCSKVEPKSESESVDAISSAATPVEALIIDVRTKDEWDLGHLDQAIHIPHNEVADRIGDYTSDAARKIVLYCKSGGRAGLAKTALDDAGFTNVENAGGYEDIRQSYE